MKKCPHCSGDISEAIDLAVKQEAEQNIENASKWIQTMIEEGIDYETIKRSASLTIFKNLL